MTKDSKYHSINRYTQKTIVIKIIFKDINFLGIIFKILNN